jgi:hypothetical protein
MWVHLFVIDHMLEHNRLQPLNMHAIYGGHIQAPNLTPIKHRGFDDGVKKAHLRRDVLKMQMKPLALKQGQ